MISEEHERLEDLPAEEAEPEEPRRGRRPWWRRKPVKRAFVWTHRWSALVLGLLLLVVTTSGVPLIYQEEIVQAQHSSAYEESGGPRELDHAEAYAAVQQHDPEFAPAAVCLVLAIALRRPERWRTVALVAASVELVGVLGVGIAEQLSETAWPDETVWSGFGAGYGWAPLVLPVAALVVLSARPRT